VIEANPAYHRALLTKNRHAYVLRGCLSPDRRPSTVRVQPAGVLGGIARMMHRSHVDFIGARTKPEVEVNCFPLDSVAEALGITQVLLGL